MKNHVFVPLLLLALTSSAVADDKSDANQKFALVTVVGATGGEDHAMFLHEGIVAGKAVKVRGVWWGLKLTDKTVLTVFFDAKQFAQEKLLEIDNTLDNSPGVVALEGKLVVEGPEWPEAAAIPFQGHGALRVPPGKDGKRLVLLAQQFVKLDDKNRALYPTAGKIKILGKSQDGKSESNVFDYTAIGNGVGHLPITLTGGYPAAAILKNAFYHVTGTLEVDGKGTLCLRVDEIERPMPFTRGELSDVVGTWRGPPMEAKIIEKSKGHLQIRITRDQCKLGFQSEDPAQYFHEGYMIMAVKYKDKKRYLVLYQSERKTWEVQFERSGDTLKLTFPRKLEFQSFTFQAFPGPVDFSGTWKRTLFTWGGETDREVFVGPWTMERAIVAGKEQSEKEREQWRIVFSDDGRWISFRDAKERWRPRRCQADPCLVGRCSGSATRWRQGCEAPRYLQARGRYRDALLRR
jgi:hypothetical protein